MALLTPSSFLMGYDFAERGRFVCPIRTHPWRAGVYPTLLSRLLPDNAEKTKTKPNKKVKLVALENCYPRKIY